MNARVDHLLDEALLLPAADRSTLVVALLDSMEGSEDASIPEAWRAELHRRKMSLIEGSITPVSWAEVRARLSAL